MPDYRTEAQKVVDVLREAILSGKYQPGERLPQRKLAKLYHTTTIVVRDALRDLASEGIVIFEPKWGAMVEEITLKKLYGRYVVREALEGMAARLASHISSPSVSELKRLARECDKNLSGNNLSPFEKAQLHYSFHNLIVSITECDELISLIRRMYLHSIILSNAYHINWHEEKKGWHMKLVKAILSGDPDQAEKEMRVHVNRGYEMEKNAIDIE